MSANKYCYHQPLAVVLGILMISIRVFTQSGGQFTIEQNVIANGGGDSAAGSFAVGGTTGQASAGAISVQTQSALHGGFWNSDALGPTAASVSVGGRVSSSSGQGIRGVVITLAQADGTTRMCLTGSFGFYRFDEIAAGQTVIVSVKSKRYSFAQPAIVLTLADVIKDADFVAIE